MYKIACLICCICIPLAVTSQTKKEIKALTKNRNKFLYTVTSKSTNFTETVAFQNTDDQMIIPVTIEGHVYNFLFDTGAVTIISRELKEQLNLQKMTTNNIMDASGKIQSEEIYSIQKLQLGNITFNNVGTASGDLEKISKAFCVPLDGILGTNVMRTCNWKINYQQSTLTFSDKNMAAGTGFEAIDFEENFSGSPVLRLFLGQYNFKTIMDTGNNKGFNIPENLFFMSNKAKTTTLQKGYGSSSYTLFGNKPTTEYIGILDTIHIDRILFKNQEISISSSTLALLGNQFFNRFDSIMINWKKHKLYIPKEVNPMVETYRSYGFIPLPDNGKLVVGFIWDNSDIQQQGLQLGDRIVAINGKELNEVLSDTDWCDIKNLLTSANDVEIAVIKNEDKKTTYTIKKYTLLP